MWTSPTVHLNRLFEPRTTPGQLLAERGCQKRYVSRINPRRLDIYLAAESTAADLKKLAADNRLTLSGLYQLIADVRLRLDRNILRCHPGWAYSLVPYAIELRYFHRTITQAEAYLQMLADMLAPSVP